MAEAESYGPYLVYEQIGRGGMATVHRAEQSVKGGLREVALKRLLPTLNKELVSLFLDESKLLRYLRHPNIAATFDSGKVFGTYFISMEYVPGPTLKALVEHCRKTVGAVQQPIAVHLAAQLCDALDHAHNAVDEKGKPLGIVHRDVTPANLIVSPGGVLKLIDFGLAKAQISSDRSSDGVIKGKFGYVAPEYLKGQLDHRADLWAVGIILYELLTGRRLFDGPDPLETMTRVKSLPIPRPSMANPTVTAELDQIVMSALERDPAKRWQSAAEMRDKLRAELDGQYVDEGQVGAWVTWVFTQENTGRTPQLTPHLPSRIISDTTQPDLQHAAEMVRLGSAPSISGPAPDRRKLALWIGSLVALAIVIGLVVRLAG